MQIYGCGSLTKIKEGTYSQQWEKKESEEFWETKEKNRKPAPATPAPLPEMTEPQMELLASPKKLCVKVKNYLYKFVGEEDTSFHDFPSFPVLP